MTGVQLTGAGLVISCSQDATLRIWSRDTGAVIRVVHNKLHITVTRGSSETRGSSVVTRVPVQCMSVSPQRIVICDRSSSIFVLDLARWRHHRDLCIVM